TCLLFSNKKTLAPAPLFIIIFFQNSRSEHFTFIIQDLVAKIQNPLSKHQEKRSFLPSPTCLELFPARPSIFRRTTGRRPQSKLSPTPAPRTQARSVNSSSNLRSPSCFLVEPAAKLRRPYKPRHPLRPTTHVLPCSTLQLGDRTSGPATRHTRSNTSSSYSRASPPPTEPSTSGDYLRLVDEWLRSLDMIFEVMDCPEPHRIMCSQLQMVGDVGLWWHSYWEMRPGEKLALTWAGLKALLREKYYPAHYRERMERQFLALEQGARTIDEYERDFTRLGYF
ncbi:Unknown protein, partial [Striga hermonthica]